jgi:L-fuconolactonase
MRIIDSHAHVAGNWYEPLATLDDQMHRTGVAGAVLTQPLGQTDNAYIQSCRRSDPERFATIVLVDPADSAAITTLRALARDGAAGVRLRPDARSPNGDGLDVWRAAADLGLAVSSPGTSEAFASEAFAELVAAFPELAIVCEHLAGKNPSAFALARFPNVYVKVPGLGEIAPRAPDRNAAFPFTLPEPDPFAQAIAAFGADRLMWGSDFPVVCSREGYANALHFCLDRFASRSEAEQCLIFGGVAARIFPTRP